MPSITGKFNDKDVVIEIRSNRVTTEGRVSRTEINKALRRHRDTHYLVLESTLLTSRKPAVSIESQLGEWVGEFKEGEWLFVLPFDDIIYTAKAEVTQNYVAVIDEQIIEEDQLIPYVNDAAEMGCEVALIKGGTRTQRILDMGFAGVAADEFGAPLELDPTGQGIGKGHQFKKSTDFEAIVKPIAFMAMLAILALIYQNVDFKKKKEIVQVAPEVASTAGVQIEAFGGMINAVEPLWAHGLRSVETLANQVTLRGQYRTGLTDMERLNEIAHELGGQAYFGNTEWVITGLTLTHERRIPETLKSIKNSGDQIHQLEAQYLIEVTIGTPRQLPLSYEREDVIKDERIGIDGDHIASLGRAIDALYLPAGLQKANVMRQEYGGWRQMEINIRHEGTNK